MADKFPLANGVWSNAANWNGGTLPLAGDDVFADGKTVTIDQSVTVLSIRTTARSGGTSGGTFTIDTGGYTITCTSATGMTTNISATAINITATSGTTTINSNLTGGGSYTVPIVALSGASNLNINGNIVAGSGNGARGLQISSLGSTVTIVGNVTGGSGGSGSHGISISNSVTINITGNVTGGTGGTSNGILNSAGISTINITGNLVGSISSAISLINASTINITGNCTSNSQTAITATSATVTVVGTITASNSAVGINVGSCTISTPCINSANGVNAVYSGNVKIYASAVASWLYKDESNNNKYLYSAGVALGNPLEADVRDATVYGASNELTGTMIVPLPSDVRISVPTDNTVGTGQLTAADFLAAISGSADAIATRLRNVSTVDTTGAQMASYNI